MNDLAADARWRGYSGPDEPELVNDGFEMRPLGERPELGMGTTIATDDRRDLAGVIEALHPEQVEIIIRSAYGIAADPLRRRAGDAYMLHNPMLKVFNQRSATQLYSETLAPEMQKAIADKRVTVGMTHEQVKLVLGQSDNHGREVTKDGIETEWQQYGKPPGKITFVTFAGSKVIAVKDQYAGLGGDVTQR